MENKLDRLQLIDLVKRIMACDGTEQQVDQWLQMVKQNVPDSNVSDLIYHSEREMTAEEIVDAALAFKPDAIGGES